MKFNFLTGDQHIVDGVKQFLNEWDSESTYITTFTSGSTGNPKEIRLEKSAMIASAKTTGEHLKLKPGDTALLCLSPHTIAGKMMMVRSIVLHLELFIGEITSRPLENITMGFDFAAMVPMQLQNSIEYDLNLLNSCNTIIVGGGPVSVGLSKQIESIKAEVYHTFGMTETISHIAMRNLSKGDIAYTALPNVSFDIDDDCLVINALHLNIEGLKTNDSVEIQSPTSFKWLGRKDFVINSGGVKIHPEHIEALLSSSIHLPYFIAGIDDAYLGSKVILCVESGEDTDFHKEDIHAKLTRYQLPKEVYVFDKFERTESNKINRILTLANRSSAKKQVL